MTVQCKRDNTRFEAIIEPYPGKRKFIECPTCHRRYFEVDSTPFDEIDQQAFPGQWFADRALIIIS